MPDEAGHVASNTVSPTVLHCGNVAPCQCNALTTTNVQVKGLFRHLDVDFTAVELDEVGEFLLYFLAAVLLTDSLLVHLTMLGSLVVVMVRCFPKFV